LAYLLCCSVRLLTVNSNTVTIWPAVGQLSSWVAFGIWSWEQHGARARARGCNVFCVCGPNVNHIQLFCASKRCSGVKGFVMPYLLWLRSSIAWLPPRATVLADTY